MVLTEFTVGFMLIGDVPLPHSRMTTTIIRTMLIFHSSSTFLIGARNLARYETDHYVMLNEAGNLVVYHNELFEDRPGWLAPATMAPNGVDIWQSGGITSYYEPTGSESDSMPPWVLQQHITIFL